ncbi:MAG: Ig-like domain-containing protein [Butyrivibrio sp.]|nr:Ig-like domain-containing protein [Butyrivibrio sp.]
MKKRLLALLLSGVMFIGNSGSALAASTEGAPAFDASEDENLSSSLENSTETISGAGEGNSSDEASAGSGSSGGSSAGTGASTEDEGGSGGDSGSGSGSSGSSRPSSGASSDDASRETSDDAVKEKSSDTPSDASSESSSDAAAESSSDAAAESSSDAAAESSSGKTSTEEDFEMATGALYEDDIMDFESVKDLPAGRRRLYSSSALPSYYVNEDLSSLKNQNPYGTCWAFATTAMAEMSLRKRNVMDSPDLSELHLVYFTNNSVTDPLGGLADDITYNEGETGSDKDILHVGGTYIYSFNALASWKGCADESALPYSNAGTILSNSPDSGIAYNDTSHVKNYYFEPINNDPDSIKRFVYNYGAAGIQYYAKSSCYNAENNCYYNDVASTYNHAVSIVGWDDNFPKENFKKTPPGDGAFLVRNSYYRDYDEEYSYNGYFWMSYYEATLGENTYAGEFESASNYDNNYQYDGALSNKRDAYGKTANVFTAHASNESGLESLRAVSFFTDSSNVTYNINVYKNLSDANNPESGELVDTLEGETSYAGMYTIDLDEYVTLENGDTFSAVVKLTKSEKNVTVAHERSVHNSSIVSNAGATAGQSFYYSGGNWVDFGQSQNCNFKIKAYTDNISSESVIAPGSISFTNVTDKKITLQADDSFVVETEVLPADSNYGKLIWESSDDDIATVYNGKIYAKGAGTAIITARTNVGNANDYIVVTVTAGTSSITYVLGDGTQHPDNPSEYTESVGTTLYNARPPVGYRFDGWYTDPSFSAASRKSAITKFDRGDITLYAKYAKLKFTVRFVTYCEDDIDPVTVEYGDHLSVPSELAKEGYYLKGWYSDPTFQTMWNFEQDTITTYTTLYARWIKSAEDIVLTDAPTGNQILPSIIETGETIRLSALVLPEETEQLFSWKDYDEDPDNARYACVFPTGAADVTLNSDGTLTITGKAQGTVTVTATADNDQTKTVVKTFTIHQVLPYGLLLKVTEAEELLDDTVPGILVENETSKASLTLSATVYKDVNPTEESEKIADQRVEWAVSDPKVITLEETVDPGVIKVAPASEDAGGTALVYATSKVNSSCRAAFEVVVWNPETLDPDVVHASELKVLTKEKTPRILASSNYKTEVDETGVILARGKSLTVTSAITPATATKTVVYSSGNPAVATINSAGKITAKSAGEAVITATSHGLELVAAFRVKVYDPVTSLTLDKKTLKIGAGQSGYLEAKTILPTTASDEVEYKVTKGKDSVITISKLGSNKVLIKGNEPGTVTVTAKTIHGEKSAKCTVTVGTPVEYIEIYGKKHATSVAVGKSLQMVAEFNYGEKADQPANKGLKWEIAEGSQYATIDPSKGIIKAKAEGTIKVVASSTTDTDEEGQPIHSLEETIEVYVPLKKAKLSKTSVTMAPGFSYTLNAIFTPTITGVSEDNHVTGENVGIDLLDQVQWRLKYPNRDYDYLELPDGTTGVGPSCTITAKEWPISKKIPVIAQFTPYGKSKPTTLTCYVTVTNKKLSKIKLSSSSVTIGRGATAVVSATLTPTMPEDGDLIWEIPEASADKISFVDDEGAIIDGSSHCTDGYSTPNKVGIKAIDNSVTDGKVKAKVIVKQLDGKVSATCNITIVNEANYVQILSGKKDVTKSASDSAEEKIAKTLQLATGKSSTLKAVVYTDPDTKKIKAGSQKVTWSLSPESDPTVAKVSSTGKVTALKTGEVDIMASSVNTNLTYGDKESKAVSYAHVYVYAPGTKVALDKTKGFMSTKVGNSTRDSSYRHYDVITARVTPESIYDNAVLNDDRKSHITWTVDPKSTGTIAVYAIETSEVTAAKNGYAKQNVLSMYDAAYEDLAPKTGSFVTGKDESLAVKAISPGIVKLTATAPGGKKATCTLTIYTHVTDVNLKLGWDQTDGENGAYSAALTKAVTVNKVKTKVKVVEKSEDPAFDYTVYLDKKTVKTITLKATTDYFAGLDEENNPVTAAFFDKKRNAKEKALTALYTKTKKRAVNSAVNYRSLDPRVATVNSKGVITAVTAGETVIVMSASDGSAAGATTKRIKVIVSSTPEESLGRQ